MIDESKQTAAPEGVQYQAVAADYFEKRKLRPYAKSLHLWALGVGAVISGDFAGWNLGLGPAGFGGFLVATAIVTVMFIGLCFSIAEMAPALPHAGGAYSFARTALGPWAGLVTGIAENMEYVLTPATIVVAVGSYLGAVLGTDPSLQPLYWTLTYILFVGLNIAGAKTSFRTTLVVTFLALGCLALFWVLAIPHLSWAHAFDIPADPGQSSWFPFGVRGVLASLPFAIWFYLGIEELPLAAEEATDPKRDLPRGILLALGTLIVATFLTLILNTAMAPGAAALAKSPEPLLDGFRTILGEGALTSLLILVAVTGLIASFHTIIFAYGRQIYSLSRAGYFPRSLSLTHPTRATPAAALVVGGIVGLAVAFLAFYAGDGFPVLEILLTMAVFGAIISYVLQLVSFVVLRLRRPKLERPFRSPLGITGAVVALTITLVALVALFLTSPVAKWVGLGAVVWYGFGLSYFALRGRHQLVRSPEEEFALRRE